MLYPVSHFCLFPLRECKINTVLIGLSSCVTIGIYRQMIAIHEGYFTRLEGRLNEVSSYTADVDDKFMIVVQ